jgi:hypothetical protein
MIRIAVDDMALVGSGADGRWQRDWGSVRMVKDRREVVNRQ